MSPLQELKNKVRTWLGLCIHDWTVFTDSDWMYIARCRKCGKEDDYMKW